MLKVLQDLLTFDMSFIRLIICSAKLKGIVPRRYQWSVDGASGASEGTSLLESLSSFSLDRKENNTSFHENFNRV